MVKNRKSKKKMKKNKNFKIFSTTLFFATLIVSLFLIGIKTNFFGKADFEKVGRKANITVDFGRSQPLFKNWGFFAQGGESPKDTLSTVSDKMKKLDPAYIRIDHIYDFYGVVKRNSKGVLEYDFSRLDEELNAITDMGAKPFISLSYMPGAISRGTEVDLPVDWKQWQQVVQKTVEHISGIDDLGIKDVYYEVWNEPDLFGKFTLSGEKNYLDLYRYASNGATSAYYTHEFKFGGPAMTNLMKKWFTTFLEYSDKNNLRVDFLSWHRYSKNVGDFERDAMNAKEWLSKYPKFENSTFVISEAGINSELDPAYDNTISAIHTMQVATVLQKHNISVFNFEIKDGRGPVKYWGRWGILTNEFFGDLEEKPRYHAFAFLNQMKGERVEIYGEGSWVKGLATSEPKNKIYRLLLVNYDKYGNHEENVPVTINNLPGKSFKLRQTDFMGREVSKVLELPNNSWSQTVYMSPNSAIIFELTNFK